MTEMISVIIPTYNEKDNVLPLLERLAKALQGYRYEVIFVDDASSDGTAEVLSNLSLKYPLRVIVRKDERGLASAVVRGLGEAKGDYIVVMDADLQHPPEVIPQLVRRVENEADIAVASRYVSGGGVEKWGLVRRITSKGAIAIAHLLLPSTRVVKDPMSGFFILRREVMAGVTLAPRGYKILLEILMLGQFKRVTEVPFIFPTRSQGKSKLGFREEADYLRHVLSLMRRSGELSRFIKFCLVGLSGVVVNMGLLWLLTELAGLHYLISNAISIEASILSNFFLNNFFTFSDRNQSGTQALLGRLLRFNLVSLVGLGINLGIVAGLTEGLGLYYMLSNLVGIAVAMLWNYLANNWWTWAWRK